MLLDIYLTHRTALIDYAANIVGSRAGAEDVVQDAYLRVAALGPADRRVVDAPISHPVAYLYRIVRNLAVDGIRRLSSERVERRGVELMDQIEAPAASPERDVLYRQQLRLMAAALSELPQRTQTAFEMHRLGGHSLHEVAQSLGISVTLAHQLVHRAISHCASRLGEV